MLYMIVPASGFVEVIGNLLHKWIAFCHSMVAMDSMNHFWSILGIIALFNNLITAPLFAAVTKLWELVQGRWKYYKFFRVPQYYGSDRVHENGLYNKVKIYVGTLGGTVDTQYANLYTGKNSNDISVALEPGGSVEDSFLGPEYGGLRRI